MGELRLLTSTDAPLASEARIERLTKKFISFILEQRVEAQDLEIGLNGKKRYIKTGLEPMAQRVSNYRSDSDEMLHLYRKYSTS